MLRRCLDLFYSIIFVIVIGCGYLVLCLRLGVLGRFRRVASVFYDGFLVSLQEVNQPLDQFSDLKAQVGLRHNEKVLQWL